MASSPAALSPRPNPPGPGGPGPKYTFPPKLKALAMHGAHNTASASSGTSTPGETDLDAGAQMNDKVAKAYVITKQIGQGTYADVFSAHLRTDPSKLVAIKRIRIQSAWKNGITMDSIREIRFLSELKHPNVITLHAVFSTKDQRLSMVLEHLPLGDLEEVWNKHKLPYTGADIKSWMLMLSRAVWFCHENRVLHRDIKSNNCLIAADGSLKLADFGLARPFADPGKNMTHQVITRFYRPPELLYMCRHYGGKVDIWSMGMIMGELALRGFMCPGETDIQQLAMYCDIFGTPTEETWPGVSKLELYHAPSSQLATDGKSIAARKGQPASYWRMRFSLLGDDGIDLLKGMLTMNPNKRLSAKEILQHPYFTNSPKPTKKEDLPRKPGGPDEKRMAEDLKRRPGDLDTGRADKVARKLDFGSMKK